MLGICRLKTWNTHRKKLIFDRFIIHEFVLRSLLQEGRFTFKEVFIRPFCWRVNPCFIDPSKRWMERVNEWSFVKYVLSNSFNCFHIHAQENQTLLEKTILSHLLVFDVRCCCHNCGVSIYFKTTHSQTIGKCFE